MVHFSVDVYEILDYTEDEWVAGITEAYCHNYKRIPSDDQIREWIDANGILRDISYDPGLPEDTMIEVIASPDGTKTRLTNGDVSVNVIFRYYQGIYFEKEKDVYRWDDIYTIFPRLLESESNRDKIVTVKLDDTFFEASEEYVFPTDGEKILREYPYISFSMYLRELLRTKFGPNYSVAALADSMRMSRQCLNNILNSGKNVSKRSVYSIGVGLRLSVAELESLLKVAGYSVTYGHYAEEIIIEQVKNGEYNVDRINKIIHDRAPRKKGELTDKNLFMLGSQVREE